MKANFFFEEETLKTQIAARNLLKQKLEYFSSTLTSKQNQVASFNESNLGLISAKRRVRKERLKQEIIGLSSAVLETSKSYELAADLSVKS